MINKQTFQQFLMFGIIGLTNTLLTALIIWLLLTAMHFSPYTSNIIGYIAGLINSFIWNRQWTFKSKTRVSITFYKFIITFVISYLLQLANLYLLLNFTTFDPFICQLFSIVVYSIVNFLLNKFYTFKT